MSERNRKPFEKQEEINEILIDTAKRFDHVVRLKGGDPFVFGRGGEEVLALQKENIPFQLVPGVTSAVAVPELLGIPVTHRETSRSFHVFTGHTKDGDETSLAHIHPQEGTSLFLMGISHLAEITDKLIREGKDPQTPTAVIANGCMPGEQIVREPLLRLPETLRKPGSGHRRSLSSARPQDMILFLPTAVPWRIKSRNHRNLCFAGADAQTAIGKGRACVYGMRDESGRNGGNP